MTSQQINFPPNELAEFAHTSQSLADRLLRATCNRLGFQSESVLSDVQSESLKKVILRHVFSLTEKPEECSKLAGALVMWDHYHKCPTTLRDYLKVFRTFLRPDVVTFFETHFDQLQEHIQYENDFDYSYFSSSILIDTYMSRVAYDKTPLEIPQFAWMRCAVGMFCSRPAAKPCSPEQLDQERLTTIIRMYKHFSNREGSPSSPIIFNMGFIDGASASCLIYTIDDSLDDILQVFVEGGMGSKNNAGSGIDFSSLRHSKIGRHGMSKGVIPLVKIWDDLTDYIQQGLRRLGATTASLRVQHYDTPEFISIVDKVSEEKTQVTHLTTSIMLSDLFMKRCQENAKWSLFCPKQTGKLNQLHGKAFEELYIIYEEKAKRWKRYQKYLSWKELDALSSLNDKNKVLYAELAQEFTPSIPSESDTEYQAYLVIKKCREAEINKFEGFRSMFERNIIPSKGTPAWKRYQTYEMLWRFRQLFAILTEEDVYLKNVIHMINMSNEKVFLELEDEFGSSPKENSSRWPLYQEYLTMKKQRNEEDPKYNEWRERYEGIVEEIDSREFDADALMDEIAEMECKSGMPYVIHGCNVNRKNNMCNVGPVNTMNLCQEICIPAIARLQTGCCIIAPLNLKAFADANKGFDFVRLSLTVRDYVLMLNQVIDDTRNVSDKVKRSNDLNRPIGIGVCGFADMAHILDLPFVDTAKLQEATPDYSEMGLKERTLNPVLAELNYKIWSCMYYNFLLESKEEAKRYGPYPNFWTSPLAQGRLQYHLWQEEEKETGRKYPFKLEPAEPGSWGQEGSWSELIREIKIYGVRNALGITGMPTASTSKQLGVNESTEVYIQNVYLARVRSGDYPEMVFRMVADLKAIGCWSKEIYNQVVANNGSILHIAEPEDPEKAIRLRFIKEKYLTAWEVPQKIIIQLAAQRQVFVDHSQSMNIYLATPDKQTVKAIHAYTWQMGLKTGMYYLRSRAANENLKMGDNKKKAEIRKTKLMESQDDESYKFSELLKSLRGDMIRREKSQEEAFIKETLMSASRPEKLTCTREDKDCVDCHN